MANPLIGVHAVLGEIGIVAFIWVFVEMLKPNPERLKRAKIAALLGVAFFFVSWIVGGYYYTEFYGSLVKPAIKEGPQPWAHLIFTETKEHMFLFLPFLSILAYALLMKFETAFKEDKNPKAKKAVLILSGVIVIIGALMALMGYLISSGFRAALEASVG
jgi:hypothetical protein